MKVELFPFQRRACEAIRDAVADALGAYQRRSVPQVISFTAPTGAGKTIIMASVIENILCGDGAYIDQPEAIFVWLSDSPQLNEQSKIKIETKADRIRLNQCVTIQDDSFDQELLDEGYIYFLNTQKLGKSSNLTKHSDGRTYTIWETLSNTVREKSDRLYFIIDEAHRGAQGTDAARATTIMQKFIKGSHDDGVPPMPVVIGMSATTDRFNLLIGETQSTIHKCIVTADEVRSSGLLKDRIVITYPESESAGNEMAILQAAAGDWKEKWDHWTQYCREQKHAYVNPVFVIQVLNGTDNRISLTDLNDCLSKIEERTGFRFKAGEVVHTFGQTTAAITVNGLEVRYVEPSQIADDRNIKVVFFKENLSTGWDCPRAETMMSFRHAKDATYIAQLLGRMVRTPMQMHIQVDDVLNDVHLYLPYFDEDTVMGVVAELQNSEGGNIPTEVLPEKMGKPTYEILTIGQTQEKPSIQRAGDQRKFYDVSDIFNNQPSQYAEAHEQQPLQQYGQAYPQTEHEEEPQNRSVAPDSQHIENTTSGTSTTVHPNEEAHDQQDIPTDGIDRNKILKFINESGQLSSYDVRSVKIASYLVSLVKLAHLLVQTGLNPSAVEDVHQEIGKMIQDYITKLKANGHYDEMATQVKQFELKSQIFDAFGQSIDNNTIHNLLAITDVDIERQFRIAESKLGSDGIGNSYGKTHGDLSNPNEFMIDVILFTSDSDCMERLEEYAKGQFHSYKDNHRRNFARIDSEKIRKQYDDIVSNGDPVSKHNFRVPKNVTSISNNDGQEYSDHLLINPQTGTARIKLNTWEKATLKEEQQRDDFVCWLRNQARASWALCIPYDYNGEKRPTYPDLIIIRKVGTDYVIDILEPHRPNLDDNIGKAKGFAEYARQNPGVGRIQLIRFPDTIGPTHSQRLDLSLSEVRDEVSRVTNPEELNHLFTKYGIR